MARGGKPPKGGTLSIPAPTGVSATLMADNNVYVSWNPVTNATSYWVYRDGIVLSIIQATNFTDMYAGTHITHTYNIAAVVNSTLGPQSSGAQITIA